MPVVLDTDTGDDVDDVFAIALAAKSPRIDLRAVITAYGDTLARARLARRVLDECGRGDVPVYAGGRPNRSALATRTSMESGAGFVPAQASVNPGDGGLIVLPGSHKAEFDRPLEMFYPDGKITDEILEGVVNITPKAGDIVIISELLTHGTLPWKPDRDRRTLVLRYKPQNEGGATSIPDVVLERLLPETRELIEFQGFKHVKEIVKTRLAAA